MLRVPPCRMTAQVSGGSDPVITKAPSGAWTHAIIDKAM